MLLDILDARNLLSRGNSKPASVEDFQGLAAKIDLFEEVRIANKLQPIRAQCGRLPAISSISKRVLLAYYLGCCSNLSIQILSYAQ